jgi:signal transduction histidine kinase
LFFAVTSQETGIQPMENQGNDGMASGDRTFRFLAELASDWFWEQDAEFRFTRFFGNTLEALHRDQGEFIGKRRWDMPISGVTAEELAEHIATCQRHEPFREFEYTVPGDGGVLQYYSASGMPVYDKQGVFCGYRGIARNLTELRRAEFALRKSVRQLSQIVDGSPIPAFVIDADHRVTHWNQACEALTGFSKRDMLGRTDTWRAFYSEPRPLLANLVVSQAKEGAIAEHYAIFGASAKVTGALEAESFFPSMGPGGRWLFFTAAPVRDTDMKVIGAIETLQDITEDKHQEEQRKILEAELAHAQKMESLGSLASGVAHDINNVLGAILSLASLQSILAAEGSSLKASMETITRACHRGGNLVKGLLGFARQGLAEEKILDLNHLVLEQVALLERTTLQKVRIEVDLASELLPIKGDPGALSHALLNLCVNALDAMPLGGTLTLISHNGDAGVVFLEVVDTGSGMAKEVLDKAMDPFFTTKPQGKGTGLGLSIVYGTVKAHRGKVVLQSQPGIGTRVTLRFPSCGPSYQDSESAGSQQRPARHRELHILLVDDDELIRNSIPELIGYLGHRTTTATCGEAALAKIQEGLLPDVVLLDMNMPGIGGAGALPRIRALLPDVPVIIATGRADQDALDLMEAHAHVTLSAKPFGIKELQQQLDALA